MPSFGATSLIDTDIFLYHIDFDPFEIWVGAGLPPLPPIILKWVVILILTLLTFFGVERRCIIQG